MDGRRTLANQAIPRTGGADLRITAGQVTTAFPRTTATGALIATLYALAVTRSVDFAARNTGGLLLRR